MDKMKFRTEIEVKKANKTIDYSKRCMLIGSCFTENIGQRLAGYRLPNAINPFGIVYNPISVKNSIKFLLQRKTFAASDLFLNQELWHNFYFHSRYSSINSEVALKQMNNSVREGADFLRKTDFLFITFGTAFCFRHVKSGTVVSNNHKLPGKEFERFRLSVDDIVREYEELLVLLWRENPNLEVVFTVSPVRHLKDGAHGNQLSKATLLLAIDSLVNRFDKCDYFPAYEIFMDDLREYRFYEQDMVHPNTQGVEYVWEKFQERYLDEETIQLSTRIVKILKAMAHRPNNVESDSHKKFLRRHSEMVKSLLKEHPSLVLNDALIHFDS